MDNTSAERGRIHLEIPSYWAHLRDLRSRVEKLMVGYAEELRSAATMTASELVENALKYGVPVDGAAHGQFEMTLEGGEITIQVTNGVGHALEAEALIERIERIAQAEDKAALYIERLQEFLESSSAAGGLGLFRVAFEGGFDLRCKMENALVVVTAKRALT